MLPLTDPSSVCFFTEEERVNLAELDSFADPLPPLLREGVTDILVTWGSAESMVLHEGTKDGGGAARGMPLGGSILGMWTSESCGSEL
jgi:hypothetical protein